VSRIRHCIDAYNAHRAPGAEAMTQRRLAELAGVNEVTVHRHITGQTSMSLQQAISYARVLGCRVEDLASEPHAA